eukprot:scaffold1517_cov181-Pinguiococcus_pyrenoidosus.AAC.3
MDFASCSRQQEWLGDSSQRSSGEEPDWRMRRDGVPQLPRFSSVLRATGCVPTIYHEVPRDAPTYVTRQKNAAHTCGFQGRIQQTSIPDVMVLEPLCSLDHWLHDSRKFAAEHDVMKSSHSPKQRNPWKQPGILGCIAHSVVCVEAFQTVQRQSRDPGSSRLANLFRAAKLDTRAFGPGGIQPTFQSPSLDSQSEHSS